MKQEDKKLLMADLAARIPYGVIVNTPIGDGHLCSIDKTIFANEYGVNVEATKRTYLYKECNIKPYLRPMSSMTKEEVDEFMEILSNVRKEVQDDTLLSTYRIFDFCNAKHLDYRGLIKKGLAIEVTKENNPY